MRSMWIFFHQKMENMYICMYGKFSAVQFLYVSVEQLYCSIYPGRMHACMQN